MHQSLWLVLLLLFPGCKEKSYTASQEPQPINIPASNITDDNFALLEHYFQPDSTGRLDAERNIPASLIAKFTKEQETSLTSTFKRHPILRVANDHGYYFVIECNFGSYSGYFYLLQFDHDRTFVAKSDIGQKTAAGDDVLDFTCELVSPDMLRTHTIRYYRNEKKPLDTIVRDFALAAAPVRDQLNFLDSVIMKSDLSYDQVKAHSILNNYISKKRHKNAPDPSFSGGSVYFANRQYSMAIIEYFDEDNCNGKYLLVYRSKDMKNTDCKAVVVDCSADGHECGDTSFDIINDSSFYLKDWQSRNVGNDSVQLIHTIRLCVINKKGKIEVREEREVFNKTDKADD